MNEILTINQIYYVCEHYQKQNMNTRKTHSGDEKCKSEKQIENKAGNGNSKTNNNTQLTFFF